VTNAVPTADLMIYRPFRKKNNHLYQFYMLSVWRRLCMGTYKCMLYKFVITYISYFRSRLHLGIGKGRP